MKWKSLNTRFNFQINMKLSEIKSQLGKAYSRLSEIDELRPSQEKAIKAGLFDEKNLLICTPTASGKTLVAEFSFIDAILNKGKKAIYIVPLKALATEKHKQFSQRYDGLFKCALSIGDLDSDNSYLAVYDLIICTSEKLDSLIRHHTPWLNQVGCVVVDEIHLLNDPGRGPTLEILITLLRDFLKVQLIGLSATIGNAPQLAKWLDAELVIDNWRPIQLKEGIFNEGKIDFKK